MPRRSDAKVRLLAAARYLIWTRSYGATSVDAICDLARVKKGSFYYFFASKSQLAVAAIDADWNEKKPLLDEIFSSRTPPLARLAHYFDYVAQRQSAMRRQCGAVVGCPLFTLGCEVSTQDEAIRKKVHEILLRYTRYFESAIRAAHAEGAIVAPKADRKARLLFAFVQGSLTEARIHNDLQILRGMKAGALELLGASARRVVIAA